MPLGGIHSLVAKAGVASELFSLLGSGEVLLHFWLFKMHEMNTAPSVVPEGILYFLKPVLFLRDAVKSFPEKTLLSLWPVLVCMRGVCLSN